jgi:hypothetical protein
MSVVSRGLRWARLRTEVGVRAGCASHHGHRLAAVGAHGRGREAGTEGLAALEEVLDGAVDLCGIVVSTGLAYGCDGTLSLPCLVALALTDPTPRNNNVPSICEAKALATSLLTVELVPTSM